MARRRRGGRGDLRRGGRRPGHRQGAAARVERPDALPRRPEERVVAAVRARVQLVGSIRARDADHAAIARRVRRGTRSVVAGRGDDDDVVIPGVVDRGLEGAAEAGVAEGHVDHVRAVIDRPDGAFDDVAVLAQPVGIEDGHGHDLHAGVGDPRDPAVVVRDGGDDPGHRGAVTVGVDVRIATGDEARARHELPGQVGVMGIDARVEHGDDRRPGRVDGSVDLVPADPRQRPLAVVARVARHGLRGADGVALDADDARRCPAGCRRPDEPSGTRMTASRSGAIVSTTSASAAARTLERSAVLVPAAKVTM